MTIFLLFTLFLNYHYLPKFIDIRLKRFKVVSSWSPFFIDDDKKKLRYSWYDYKSNPWSSYKIPIHSISFIYSSNCSRKVHIHLNSKKKGLENTSIESLSNCSLLNSRNDPVHIVLWLAFDHTRLLFSVNTTKIWSKCSIF